MIRVVISTPVTLVSGLAAAARRGILIKGGAFLELGRKISTLALDKTGTLTMGQPRCIDVQGINGVDGEEGLRLAASLAARSDHPVSAAVALAAREKGLSLREISEFAFSHYQDSPALWATLSVLKIIEDRKSVV